MDRLVFTTLSGLRSQMSAQAAIANNIANANTTGFRAERVSFSSMVLQGGDLEARAPASEQVLDFDRSPGAVVSTGRDLDVAVTDTAWIAVQDKSGQEAYTRRGDLRVAPTGVLETGDGFPVMGSSGPITVPPYQKISVSDDGTISIIPLGAQTGQPAQVIDKLKLADPQGTQTRKGLDNLLHPLVAGAVLPVNADARVAPGSLESSNVNLTQALVDMIENQRSYEVQANMLKEAKNLDESSASLMRMPS